MLQGACNPKMVSKSFVSCTDNLPGRRLYRQSSPAGKLPSVRLARPSFPGHPLRSRKDPNSLRTAETRDRRVSGDGGEIHGAAPSASLADVAHLLAESYRPDRGGRFLCGPDRN